MPPKQTGNLNPSSSSSQDKIVGVVGMRKGGRAPFGGTRGWGRHSEELCWMHEDEHLPDRLHFSLGTWGCIIATWNSPTRLWLCGKFLAVLGTRNCCRRRHTGWTKGRAGMAGPALHLSWASPDWRALLQDHSSVWKWGLEESSGKERKPRFLGDRQL